LGNESGVTHNTAKAWLSVLEASGVVHLLRPHHRNFSKRLVKTPKLYFTDTGLACWLLGIREPAQIALHPLRGALFETWVLAELLKGRLNRGLPSNLWFWRDNAGNEVDVLLEEGETLRPVEIKSGSTVLPDALSALQRWTALAGNVAGMPVLVYGGGESQRRSASTVLAWRDIGELAASN
ncbi:MAG: ATP-binding protein, partial [Gammaproteobacteria bacterium]